MAGESGRHPRHSSPAALLQQFVEVFASKGWLNRRLRIRYRDGRYRIFCSHREFFAYRVNDNCGLPPGAPGWPVCAVTQRHLYDGSGSPGTPSPEPGLQEWLSIVAGGDFEVI